MWMAVACAGMMAVASGLTGGSNGMLESVS